jgi:hypothetical protein
MESSRWFLPFTALGGFFFFFFFFLPPRRARKLLKVDRFEVAETGVSFLLIIARLFETFISYRNFLLAWWKVNEQYSAFSLTEITEALEIR